MVENRIKIEYLICYNEKTGYYDIVGYNSEKNYRRTFMNITKSYEFAQSIHSIIVENDVALIHVKDIICDLFCKRISEINEY